MMTSLGSMICQTSLVHLTDSLKVTEEKSALMVIQMNTLITVFVNVLYYYWYEIKNP